MPRQLDAEGAGLLQSLLEAQGVTVVTGDLCVLVEGAAQVERMHLRSGRILEADMVVVSAGVRPDVELAKSAGLSCTRGVQVDEHMRTSAPDIYAVGDVAEIDGTVWGIIPAAVGQARVAAAQILGRDAVFRDNVPTTTLKVPGIDLTSIGEVNPEGGGFAQVRRVDPDRGIYEKLVLRDGRVVGAILIGARPKVGPITQLITRHIDVSGQADSLLAEGFDLKPLLRRRVAAR